MDIVVSLFFSLIFVPKFTYTIFMGGFFRRHLKDAVRGRFVFTAQIIILILGTRRGGLATYSKEHGFIRSIHNFGEYLFPDEV